MLGCCVPVIFAALVILLLSMLNPKWLQGNDKKGKNGKSGRPCPVKLALLALAAGWLGCLAMRCSKGKCFEYLNN